MSVAEKYTNVELGYNKFNQIDQNIGELKAMYLLLKNLSDEAIFHIVQHERDMDAWKRIKGKIDGLARMSKL